MSFGADIYRVKRLKGTDPHRALLLERYNNWYHKYRNEKSWEEFIKQSYYENINEFKPTSEEIEFYILNDDNRYKDKDTFDYGEVYTVYQWWCSDARSFDYKMSDILKHSQDSDGLYREELTRDGVVELLKWVREELDKYSFKRVYCDKSFREIYDDDFYEPSEIILVPCDGIEVIDEDGNIKRISCDYESSDIFISKDKYYDEWEVNGLKKLEETLINILIDFNFEDEMLFYISG